MPRLAQRITLPDGRILCFDEHGPPGGTPLMYVHGSPSARVEWALFGDEPLLERLGIRLIVPDRPGCGLSDFQPGRSYGDWPRDVSALADALEIARFAVLGFSAGGPYAAACALAFPDRLSHVGLVSSLGPHDRTELTDGLDPTVLRFRTLARQRPLAAKLALRLMGLTARLMPARLVSQALASLPEPDRIVLARPGAQETFAAMVREAVRQGPRGAHHDVALMAAPWGFAPEEIASEVALWHGEEDVNATPAMARYLAGAIPRARATLFPTEGHLSVFANHREEILGALTQ